MGKKLTIGMVVHDDFDGLYFTIQSIRCYHPEIINQIEFLVIDNNPSSESGLACRDFCQNIGKYVPYTDKVSTSVRQKIFDLASTPFVLCTDCHVLFKTGSIFKLIEYFQKDSGDLLQGPLLHDDCMTVSTHFILQWRQHMWGIWADSIDISTLPTNPFEIPAQGLGVFACRKDCWLGFNPHFCGFGGEEGYIHEKFRQNGKKVMCLPFLQWMHRFGRPKGVTYPLNIEDRIRNYFIGFKELNLDPDCVFDHFKRFISIEQLQNIYNEIYTIDLID